MVRSLTVFMLFLAGAFFSGIYLAYGSFDPCRALAVEEARQSPVPTGVAKLWTRIHTSGMTPLACSRALVLSWYDRVTDDPAVKRVRRNCP